MKRNIELKAQYGDLPLAHQIARSLGAALDGTEQQRDTYFAVACGRLKLRQRWVVQSMPAPAAGSTIDAPVAKPAQLIWYHRSNQPRARPSDYSLVQLPDGEAIRLLLGGALGVAVQVTKVRTVYLFDNVRIHLDQVDELGSFLEFEAIVDECCDEAAAEQKIRQLRATFQLADSSLMSQSYADLVESGSRPINLRK